MDFTSDNRLLIAKAEDAVRLCDKYGYPHFVGFLDERQQAELQSFAKRVSGVKTLFYGGYPTAGRTFFGAFPDFMETDEAAFPFEALTFSYRDTVSLSHRDFLGTILSIGVKREKVGDIVCGKGKTVVFVGEEIVDFLCEQITKVGGEGVTIEKGLGMDLPTERAFRENVVTVASPRLDNVVKGVIGVAREKAATLIVSGAVSLNHLPCETVSKTVVEGDILSIRGYGRFLVYSLSQKTKKDRLILVSHQYV